MVPELRTTHAVAASDDTAASAPGPHVEVVVTLPVPSRYTYRVPTALANRAVIGSRVLVRFGTRKVTGVVVRERVTPPAGIKTLDLSEVLDDTPALPGDLIELCLWVSDYYEAPLGEVMRAALPAGSGESARQVVTLTEAGRAAASGHGGALPGKQRVMLAKLLEADLPTSALSSANRALVAALTTAKLAETIDKRDRSRVRLKQERVVELAMPLAQAREAVARSPKRFAVIDALASGASVTVVELEKLVPNAGTAVRALEKDGVVRVFSREQRLEAVATGAAMHVSPPPVLTDEQRVAVDTIVAALGIRRLAAAPATAAAEAEADADAEAEADADADVDADADAERAGLALPATDSSASGLATSSVTPTLAPATDSGAGGSSSSSGKRGFAAFLLHGVTGSGKTEVYLRVIAEAMAAGKTALVLVPEISLTPQLAARFRARFGDLVAILHSGLTDQQRLGEWSRLRRGDAKIAVGARSAVFAPLAELGVIVVDEEHDGSFKQEEGVRYHARDVALVRAQRAGAVCVLGSATPSLETATHAERGQYRRLMLTERPTARPMPAVEIVDLKTWMPDGEAMLSAPLRTAIAETLAAGDQIILFLNRRGFATFVLCTACGHSFRCPHCSVSLTYHKHNDRLSCHYCNRIEVIPDVCPKCKTQGSIERKGLGTEKVAAAVAEAFPDARVARLDRDVASGAKVEAVLSRVARREVDVLVGTQMVTKGHDFPGVTLVGVLCADTGLTLPDFRAAERTFQLLAQVAGRAGRGERPGRVLIQTYRPDSHAVVAAAAHDYAGFYAAEIADRVDPAYPPHARLILVRLDGPNAHEVAGTAQKLAHVAEDLARKLGDTVEIRGPVPAPIERLRNRTRWQVWLRSPDRQALRRVARGLLGAERPSAVRVVLDVDPNSTM